jgi:hypothetical protein
MLGFERHFLARYREFLLDELRAGDERRERAAWVMGQIPFEDPEVRSELFGDGRDVSG